MITIKEFYPSKNKDNFTVEIDLFTFYENSSDFDTSLDKDFLTTSDFNDSFEVQEAYDNLVDEISKDVSNGVYPGYWVHHIEITGTNLQTNTPSNDWYEQDEYSTELSIDTSYYTSEPLSAEEFEGV